MKKAITEIRGQDVAELQAKLGDLRKEQFGLRFRGSAEEVAKTTRHREVRRTIARIMTVLGERSAPINAKPATVKTAAVTASAIEADSPGMGRPAKGKAVIGKPVSGKPAKTKVAKPKPATRVQPEGNKS